MRFDIAIGTTAYVFAQCLAFAALAQTATQAAVPAPAPSSAATVVQAQLNARAPSPDRVGGGEADAIYKRYVTGIGQPLVSTVNPGTSQSGSGMHSAGSQ